MDIETRKLASIRTIDSLEPIDGADAIELAVVGGWKVVVKKGEFKPGDLAVYFEIDSFLHDGMQPWQFLVDKSPRMHYGIKGHRLRTIKLRGQISQGLLLDPKTLPQLHGMALEDGMDVTKTLSIVKWDPPLPAQLAGQAEGFFPSFIHKTDQERAQNLKSEIFGFEDTMAIIDLENVPLEAANLMAEKGIIRWNDDDGKWYKVTPAKGDPNAHYEVTMKLDGSSATFFHRDGEVGVCSRNLRLKVNDENKDNSFVRMLYDSGLFAALPVLGNIAIQGELMGPGIQDNREQLQDFKLFIFDVQLIDEDRYMAPNERLDLMDRLIGLGVNPNKVTHVPILHYNVNLKKDLGIETMDQLLKFAEGPSIRHQIREGLVYKNMDESFSFKTISNLYLAKEKD